MYTKRALKEAALSVKNPTPLGELSIGDSAPKYANMGALELAPPQYLKLIRYLC